MKQLKIGTVICLIATIGLFTTQLIAMEKASALPIIRGGGGGGTGGGGTTPVPTKTIDGGTYVHWYQITNMNDIINLLKGAMLTGGYLVAAIPLATAIVGGVASGAWPAAAAAAATLAPTSEKYYNQIKQLHGFGARGDDLMYPLNKITTNTGASCKVVDVYVRLLDKNYNEIGRSTGVNPASAVIIWPFSSIGVSVMKERPGTDQAAADIHWWYDMGTAVRYQLLYTVTGGSDCAIR